MQNWCKLRKIEFKNFIQFQKSYLLTHSTSRIESPPKQMTEAVIVDAQYSSLSRNCIGRCIRTRSRSQNFVTIAVTLNCKAKFDRFLRAQPKRGG